MPEPVDLSAAWADEDWAIAEAAAGARGSPFVRYPPPDGAAELANAFTGFGPPPDPPGASQPP